MHRTHRRTPSFESLLVAAALPVLAATTGCSSWSSPASATKVATNAAAAYSASGTNITVSPDPLDFGVVMTSATLRSSVTNTSSGPLAVTIALCSDIPTSSKFTFVARPGTSFNLDPSVAASIDVTYTAMDPIALDSGCISVFATPAGGTAERVDLTLKANGFTAPQATNCAACHGNRPGAASGFPAPSPAWVYPAPPRPESGAYDTPTTDPKVGAHHEHILSSRARNLANPLAKPIFCSECHLWPMPTPAQPGHKSGTTFRVWGSLATNNGQVTGQTYSGGATATCANIYCHGATLAGGTNKTPQWTLVDGSQSACGTCHGVPPPAPHPQLDANGNLDCGGCHPGYTQTSVNVATHVNGTLDVIGGACNACHGTADQRIQPVTGLDISPAPPRDPTGASTTTAPGVGAHLAHLTKTNLRATPVLCTDCHAYPPASPHPNGTVTLTWSTLAQDRMTNAGYDFTTGTCNIYCHGATIGGAPPVWTKVSDDPNALGPQAACGTCHGLPPTAPHGNYPQCGNCHPGYTSTSVNKAAHINGKVELNLSCSSCHGDAARTPTAGQDANLAAAPPVDLSGNTAKTAPGVGAHQAHLTGTHLKNVPLACKDCHPVPASTSGHPSGTLDVTLVSGTFNSGSLTCSGVACHGSGGALSAQSGGTNKTPLWTGDSSQAACGTCHGAPPPLPHPQSTQCGVCHPGYGTLVVNPALHMDGALQVNTTCSSCHGDSTRPVQPVSGKDITAAPPKDTLGNTSATAPGVGAHQAHLASVNLVSPPVACTECHVVPTTTDHAMQPLNLTFTGRAVLNATPATFSATALNCSNYCHGASLTTAGGTNKTPVWNGGSSQAACGTCHGAPPPPPHPVSTACGNCHDGYTATSVNVATHINGKIDVPTSCTACHGDATRVAAAGQDANIGAAPPVDTAGLTSSPAVGAHLGHLQGTLFRSKPIQCADCHAVPAAGSIDHASKPLDLTWGALAKTGGVTPAFNPTSLTCSNYCHGASLPGGNKTNPAWTDTAIVCGNCHALPPAAPHPANNNCAACHPGYTATTVNAANHINGTVDYSLTCTSCHGTASRTPAAIAPAPPVDTKGNTATTAAGVGAHQTHLTANALRNAMACTDCHTVPTSVLHSNGVLDLTWGTLAKTAGVTPTWNATNYNCTNYCHGAKNTGGSDTTPIWNKVDGTQAKCGTCHGTPPSSGRHSRHDFGCGTCHIGASGSSDGGSGGGSYRNSGWGGGSGGSSSFTVDPARHVNGVIDLQSSLRWSASAGSCSPSCHGTKSWYSSGGSGGWGGR